jgi:hypothetical protein
LDCPSNLQTPCQPSRPPEPLRTTPQIATKRPSLCAKRQHDRLVTVAPEVVVLN